MLKNDSVRAMKRHELAERIQVADPTISDNQAHYQAGKLKRKAQRRDLGFEEGLRILGVHSDRTPREAIRNIETKASI